MSRGLGGPITSLGPEFESSASSSQLIRLVRRGQSFSGRERNCLFRNNHDGTYSNASGISGFDFPDDARALGLVDWNHDGDIDLWVANRNAPRLRYLDNQIDSRNHFVAIKLRGTRSNRDAIGARLTLLPEGEGEKRPIVRTVRAGDGYLSQSSKWLCIGVGRASSISTVTVRWPSGLTEIVHNVSAGQWYRMVEGEGKLRLWHTPQRQPLEAVSFANSTEPGQSMTAAYSFAQLPIPRLTYEDFESNIYDLVDLQDRPVLLLLWASWCAPCLEELRELQNISETLKDQGVHVVALSVDGIQNPPGTTDASLDAARAFAAELSSSFRFGIASPNTVDKLQLLNDYMFGLQKPFPIPVGFLIGPKRRLAAVYRGRVAPTRILNDIESLEFSVAERRDYSVPFPGKWIRQPRTLPLAPYVRAMIRDGFLEDASEYIETYQAYFQGKTILVSLLVDLGMAYRARGDLDAAQLHFKMAKKVNPKTTGPEVTLGQSYEKEGEYSDALSMYRDALATNPNSIAARNNLAWLLATCPDDRVRDAPEALQHAAVVVQRTQHRNAAALDTLAAALAADGRFDDAVKLASDAEAVAKAARRFSLAAQISRRRELYVAKKPFRLADRSDSSNE